MAVEKILLFCYHYDPTVGSYTSFAMNLMRAGGVLSVGLLAWYLVVDVARRKEEAATIKEGLA